ncbi:NF-kappa-B inhibitor zeta isoform X1 [Anarrhichthys ocellatus]|uniref:NF-kappa-B inhibitor zeta isoform X1 n=2 Tax=Anarrhichthys ocellatus TaxID=433405 RepID=UPI0012ED3BF9|nr:NF-kappa-B inhibitor zeta-like isoform X1 [Anarrhichthys ocellatus]
MSDSFNILDPRGDKSRGKQILPMGTNFNQNHNDFLITDPRPPEYVQVLQKKTVKELLMMRRQRWNCSQDDKNSVHAFKSAKFEVCGNEPNRFTNHLFTASAENAPVTPQQLQRPALQRQAAPAAEVDISFFHWQIQRELQRVRGVPPELLNTQDADGDTCLHIAVAQGRRALAYVLAVRMARCGSLDMKEHNGQTALQIAATTNQQLIVQDLLTHGAQINTRDYWGRSPLHVCAEKGYFLTLQSIWRTLMGSGQPIDIEMFNYDGFTPLHAAVLSHNAIVKELKGSLCSYKTKELLQKTQMSVECIKTLLLMGASCGTKDQKSGRTCLHMASAEANVELFNIFLAQPSSLSVVNVQTFSGNTALHIVSSLQNHDTQVEAVKLLMRKGGDPGTRNFENELPTQLVPEGPVGEKVQKILKGKYLNA